MIIGLTGNIGCGKSTAGRMFEEFGYARSDSDEIVRDLLAGDQAVNEAIRDAFGDEVFEAPGVVSRRKLASIVFSDAAALRMLESILHPRVAEVWTKRVSSAPERSWIVEIPLLFEKGLQERMDRTICVASSRARQLERLASRGVSAAEAERRLAHQLPLTEKMRLADYVLTNNGSLEFLRRQVVRLVDQLKLAESSSAK